MDRVFSSQLQRARESAEILAAACGAPLVVDSRLNEIGYGEWDGLTWAEIEQGYPTLAAQKLADWWGVTPPGGEHAELFAARLVSFWTELMGSGLRSAAIVAHSAVNSCLVSLARRAHIDWDEALHFTQEHGECFEMDIEP